MTQKIAPQFSQTLGEVARMWRTWLGRRLKPHGVSQAQWMALSQLSRSGDGVLQKDLADTLGIEGPTMAGVLDRLVSAGYVERRECTHDRRGKTIHLLPAAHQLLDETQEVVEQLREEILGHIDSEELIACWKTLNKIAERVENLS